MISGNELDSVTQRVVYGILPLPLLRPPLPLRLPPPLPPPLILLPLPLLLELR